MSLEVQPDTTVAQAEVEEACPACRERLVGIIGYLFFAMRAVYGG